MAVVERRFEGIWPNQSEPGFTQPRGVDVGAVGLSLPPTRMTVDLAALAGLPSSRTGRSVVLAAVAVIFVVVLRGSRRRQVVGSQPHDAAENEQDQRNERERERWKPNRY